MWGTFLSEPLPIVALVGRYPANKLIGREPIRRRRNFQYNAMKHRIPSGISRRFHRLSPGNGHVAHALRTLPPVAARILLSRAAPRLACVKPAASVHPEPGSNSSLYYFPLSSPLSRILTSSSLMSVFTLLRSALQCLPTSPNRPLPWFHYSQRSILLPHDLLHTTQLSSFLSLASSLPRRLGLQKYYLF